MSAKKTIRYSFILLLGLSLGLLLSSLYSYMPSQHQSKPAVKLEDIFKLSNTKIDTAHNSCVGDSNRSVATVLDSIFQSALNQKSNIISLDCFEHKCALSINDCKPWQSQECGSRILRFDLDHDKNILPHSFVCIDTP